MKRFKPCKRIKPVTKQTFSDSCHYLPCSKLFTQSAEFHSPIVCWSKEDKCNLLFCLLVCMIYGKHFNISNFIYVTLNFSNPFYSDIIYQFHHSARTKLVSKIHKIEPKLRSVKGVELFRLLLDILNTLYVATDAR